MKKIAIYLSVFLLMITTINIKSEKENDEIHFSILEVSETMNELKLEIEVSNLSQEKAYIEVDVSEGTVLSSEDFSETDFGGSTTQEDKFVLVLKPGLKLDKRSITFGYTKNYDITSTVFTYPKGKFEFKYDIVQPLNADLGTIYVGGRNNTNDKEYTQVTHSGQVYLKGAEIGSQISTNGYVLIELDDDYVENFTVPKADFITDVQITQSNGKIVAKVYIDEIDSTTEISFPFTFKFQDRFTPSKYSLEPIVSYVNETQPEFNVDSSKTDNTLKFSPLYKNNDIDKYIMTNADARFFGNNLTIYGGNADLDDKDYIEETDYLIPFQFRASTDRVHSGLSGNDQIKDTQFVDQIIIEDTLPQYIDKNGVTRTAVFNPDKNPNWVQDGSKVKYIVDKTGNENSMGADKHLSQIKLLLSFPGAPDKIDITNQVDAQFIFANEKEENNYSVSDDIIFKLSNDYEEALTFTKNSNDFREIQYEPNTMHAIRSNYAFNLTNPYSVPIDAFTINDDDYDSRYYFYQISLGNMPDDLKNRLEFVGVDVNGQEHIITPTGNVTTIENYTIKTIDDQIEKIHNGEMTVEDFISPEREFTNFLVRLKEGKKLYPGETVTFILSMGFIDPYGLQISEVPNDNRLENKATLSAYIDDFEITRKSGSFANLVPRKNSAVLNKNIQGNEIGTMGSVVNYKIDLSLMGMAPTRTVIGSQLIDVLPYGMKYTKHSFSASGERYIENVEIIEDFNQSGRTAIKVTLKDFKVSEFSNFTMWVWGEITEEMTPTKFETEEVNNNNNVYFSEENIDKLELTPTTHVLPDIFDINEDGNRNDMIIGDTVKTLVILPEAVRSEKYVQREGYQPTKTSINIDFDESFDYILTTKNYSSSEVKNYTLIDILPYAGSSGSDHFNSLQEPIEIDQRFEIKYSTVLPNPDPKISVEQDIWEDSVSDYTKVRAIKIVLKDGQVINANERKDFVLKMKAPGNEVQTDLNLYTTSNQFKISMDKNQNFGESNEVITKLNRDVFVEKKWNGKSLDEVVVELYRESDSTEVLGTVILDESNGFKGAFIGLSRFDSEGNLITDYMVREVLDSNNYSVEIEQDDSGVFIITNTYVPDSISFTAYKVWVGGPDEKPTVTFDLFRNDEALGMEKQLVDGVTEVTWTGLPKTDIYGNAYTYKVDEIDQPENYIKSLSDDGATVTNTYKSPLINVTGNKVWEGGSEIKPDIEIQLYQDGVELGNPVVLHSNELSYTWENLEATDVDGNPYVYTIDEVTVPSGYSKSISDDGLTITNTFEIEKIDFKAEKIWEYGPDTKPDILIQLYQNGLPYGESVVLQDGESEVIWNDLDKTDFEGNEYLYTVDEVEVPDNYIKTITDDGRTIINRYQSPLIDVTGHKVWIDGPKVKPTISLQLYRDGLPILDPVDLEDGILQHTWFNLEKTDANGELYIYTIDEVNVPDNYSKSLSEDGLTVVNTYEVSKRNITVSKLWIGGPEVKPTIDISLLRDGIVIDTIQLEDGVFTYEWVDLPVSDSHGKEYIYSVVEVDVPENYRMEQIEFNIINTFIEEEDELVVPPVDPGKEEHGVEDDEVYPHLPSTGLGSDMTLYIQIALLGILISLFSIFKRNFIDSITTTNKHD